MTISTIALLLLAGLPMQVQEPTFGMRNGSVPEPGLLFAGQPTEQQLREAVAAGYAVIDLRADSESRGFDEAALLAELDASYENIPVTGATLATGKPFTDFIRALNEAQRPALVHCGTSNRVGALYYAYLVHDQKLPREEALERARAGGLASEDLRRTVERWLDESANRNE